MTPAPLLRLRPVLPLLVAALLAPGLAGQTHSAGPLVGTPATILVGPDTGPSSGPLAEDELHRKQAGFEGFLPEAPGPGPADPSFQLIDILNGETGITVNALSIGQDVVLATIPSNGLSYVAVPPQAWGAILFSVTNQTDGEPGSLIEAETALDDNAGADLFTLMLPGSALPFSVQACYPTDRPQRALDALEMDLWDGRNKPEISAVDVYVPMYETGTPLRPLLPDQPVAFFSVSAATVANVPTTWFGSSTPSAATILRARWEPGPQKWAQPQPHLTFAELGLDVGDDIDALAVDQDRQRLIFSIVRTATSTLGEQLQVASWAPPLPFAEGTNIEVGVYVVDENEEPVAVRIRMADDGDVDGTCTIDPGETFTLLDLAVAEPIGAITPVKPLGTSLFRDENQTGATITITVAGVPTTPPAPPSRLELWFGFENGGGGLTFFPAPIYLEFLNGSDPFDHRQLSFTNPQLASLAGVELVFVWLVRPTAGWPSSPLIRFTI